MIDPGIFCGGRCRGMTIGMRKKRLGMGREGPSWYLDYLSSGVFKGAIGLCPFEKKFSHRKKLENMVGPPPPCVTSDHWPAKIWHPYYEILNMSLPSNVPTCGPENMDPECIPLLSQPPPHFRQFQHCIGIAKSWIWLWDGVGRFVVFRKVDGKGRVIEARVGEYKFFG